MFTVSGVQRVGAADALRLGPVQGVLGTRNGLEAHELVGRRVVQAVLSPGSLELA